MSVQFGILKVVGRPGVISLAGGIPSPASFPMHAMGTLASSVFDKYGPDALQYDLTEAFLPLREALSGLLNEIGVSAAAGEVLMASGSQGVVPVPQIRCRSHRYRG